MVSRYDTPSKPLRDSSLRGKIWVKPTDQMDLWLDSQGYYRKHTAKDGSCLYRAVSEQIFLAQAFHLEVRRQCAEYAQRHPELLSSVTHCTLHEYLEQMRHPHEAGGKLELELLSLMYRRDILVFHEVGKSCKLVTNNGFEDRIMLCLSQDRHYDSVYTKQFISNAAFCQSVVYEMLYKGVFELLEVDYAVKKMLHDKSSKYQRDPSSFFMNGLALRLEIRDSYVNVKDLLTLGVTPFPYKVAKSLDPDIYRNVEYDTWNDIRRGMRYGMFSWNNRELQVGVKCLVKLQPDTLYHAHIQEMAPNKGPVMVFVEELGEKMTVPHDSLELLPQPPQPQPLTNPLKQLRQLQAIKALSDTSQDSLNQVEPDEKKQCEDYIEQDAEDKDFVWSSEQESISGKITPKLKMFAELSKSNKKSNKSYRIRVKEQQHNTEAVKSQIEENCVVSSSDCIYQQPDLLSYQHDSFDEYSPQVYVHQEARPGEAAVQEEVVESRSPGSGPPAVLCLESPHYYAESYIHPAPTPAPAYCYVPHKSVLPDGSDLPLTDLATLRFYYNYGVDHYSRIRPTPPCYLNTTMAYIPDPGMYEHISPIGSPDSAVVMSPVGVLSAAPAPLRPDSLPVMPTSESDNFQHIAPRFKNKLRTLQGGRPYEQQPQPQPQPPLIQQPEVSSTTGVPVAATHYIAPPVFYQPVECDAFCPAAAAGYSVYDFYPPPPPPPHYIHPDALFYQHVVTTPLPS